MTQTITGWAPDEPADSRDLRVRFQAAITGRYTLQRELGEGGFARVFRAHEHQMDRRVAIKLLLPHASDAASVEEFVDEARTAARLTHVRILPVHAVEQTEHFAYFTMQYATGGTLRARLGRGGLPEYEALQIARVMGEALQHAHQHHVIHRDVKPENILFHNQQALLSDFGIARRLTPEQGDEHRTLRPMGTPPYMSPEQWEGTTDARSDLYSLGCVLFEMLTGRAPFAGAKNLELMAAHFGTPVPTLGSLGVSASDGVEEMLQVLLEKDPDRRFRSGKEFLERVRGILGELDERRRNFIPTAPATVALSATSAMPTATPRAGAKPAVVGQVHYGRLWHLADLHLTADCVAAALGTAASASATLASQGPEAAVATLFGYIAQEVKHADRAQENRDGRLLAPASGRALVPVVDAVIVTGNVVASHETAETARVVPFLNLLRKQLRLPAGSIMLVPGDDDLELDNGIAGSKPIRDPFSGVPTRTYVQPNGAVSFHSLDHIGLATVMIDTASVRVPEQHVDEILQALQDVFKRPRFKTLAPWIASALRSQSGTLSLDALSMALRSADRRRVKRGKHTDSGSAAQLPPSMLGIVVSHYPFASMIAEHRVEQDRIARVPSGVIQAKRVLQQAGIFLCLHGHTRHHGIHRERVRRGSQEFEFVSIGAAALTSGEPGFNSIRYAVWSETGEARVLVQSMRIEHGRVSVKARKLIAVQPRRGIPVRTTRLVENIDLHGDSITDMWYTDMSVEGWERVVGKPGHVMHDIRVRYEMDGGMFGPLMPAVLRSAGVVAHFLPEPTSVPAGVTVSAGTRIIRGNVHLTAPEDTSPFSLAYRTHGQHAYAMSLLAKIRMRTTRDGFEDLAYDADMFVHVVREPTTTLELFLQFPELATAISGRVLSGPSAEEVELRTYVQDADERLIPAPHLGELAECFVDAWPTVGQVRAQIEHPLQGVGYGLTWRLPDTDQGMEEHLGRGELQDAIREIVDLHNWVDGARQQQHRWRRLLEGPIANFFANVIDVLQRSHGVLEDENDTADASVEFGIDLEEVEIVISLPTLPHLTVEEYRERYEGGEDLGDVALQAIAALGIPEGDPRWSWRLPIPRSVSGRAFATNQVAERLSTTLARRVTKVEELDAYWHAPTTSGLSALEHTVLYAIPMRHWTRHTVVLGTVSIGSYHGDSMLDLFRPDPNQQRPTIVADVLVKSAIELARDLWSMRHDELTGRVG
ncbi:MAG: serine/threonine-protein kinase [Gemmatimonadota bacterium]